MMIMAIFLVLLIALCLIWRLKWSVTERFLLTLIVVLWSYFLIVKWAVFSNLLTELIPYIKILLVVAVIISVVVYISKKININKQEEEAKKLQIQNYQELKLDDIISNLPKLPSIKRIILGIIVFFFIIGNLGHNQTNFKKEQYEIGYLKKDTFWADEYNYVWYLNQLAGTDIVHKNYKPVKVEIWNNMPDEDIIVMIYFLEGEHAGQWGYTLKSSTISETIKLKSGDMKLDVKKFLDVTNVTAIISSQYSLDTAKQIYSLMEEYEKNAVVSKFQMYNLLKYRKLTLENYIKYLEAEQNGYVNEASAYKKIMSEYWDKAIELRQEIEKEYGF